MSTAFITGITGQDGSYLAELLLLKGYKVHGMVRRVAQENPAHRYSRILRIRDRLHLHAGEMENYEDLHRIVEEVQPDECYHLAAQANVPHSFESPFETMNINALGTLRVLDALHLLCPECRFYNAATSEMFGQVEESPQNEQTPMHPVSPYGISKLAAYHTTRMYRVAYKMHCSNGILFNHESERRGMGFVTRKVAAGAVAIAAGRQEKLQLGNLAAERDWGFAGDYVIAMWQMLQQGDGAEYVVATGESHTVEELVVRAFERVGLNWEEHVEVDRSLYRQSEVPRLEGDATKARERLGWTASTRFADLVDMMVDAELTRQTGAVLQTGEAE